MKIRLHSIVGLITNSSSIIYTYQDCSTEPFKKLVNVFLEVMGIDKTCDDLFYVGSGPNTNMLADRLTDDIDINADYPEDLKALLVEYNVLLSGDNYDKRSELFKKIESYLDEVVEDCIIKGVSFPSFIEECFSYSDYQPSSYLILIPKDDKYIELGKLFKEFLSSPNHEASYG